jgi:putative endonuclease
MAYTYILYSNKTDRFYIGASSFHPDLRCAQHNQELYSNSFTSKGIPWTVFFFLECASIRQARQIEAHIKRMKSKKFILNLKKYPELTAKLLDKYP